MGFGNEKDHPEVAPSQFEMNFTYAEALITADQVQLYKLLCRQVAAKMNMTACFLPKPLTGINGSGMHANISLSKAGANLFWDPQGQDSISKLGWDGIDRLLTTASDLCLVFNPSVNAYRRLDPHFEAPNQIKASANNRSAMVRIPAGNAKSARIEMRSVAPDVNPYMVFYTLLKTIKEGPTSAGLDEAKRSRTRTLPDNIYDAIRIFKSSRAAAEILGEQVAMKYAELKQAQAERCPKALGTTIKVAEIQFHHEVTNQYLWGLF
jgi:glutamine synthetase